MVEREEEERERGVSTGSTPSVMLDFVPDSRWHQNGHRERLLPPGIKVAGIILLTILCIVVSGAGEGEERERERGGVT